jgi:hypothetical protein
MTQHPSTPTTLTTPPDRIMHAGHALQFIPGGPVNAFDGDPRVVDDFYLGVTPVTHGTWAAFCAATKRPVPPWPMGASSAFSLGDISPGDAEAYAAFYGLRLPSTAEWQRAARGTEDTLPGPVPATLFRPREVEHPFGLQKLGHTWEWTSTPGPQGTRWVCGGHYRDQPHPRRADHGGRFGHVAVESAASVDVVLRIARDAVVEPVDQARADRSLQEATRVLTESVVRPGDWVRAGAGAGGVEVVFRAGTDSSRQALGLRLHPDGRVTPASVRLYDPQQMMFERAIDLTPVAHMLELFAVGTVAIPNFEEPVPILARDHLPGVFLNVLLRALAREQRGLPIELAGQVVQHTCFGIEAVEPVVRVWPSWVRVGFDGTIGLVPEVIGFRKRIGNYPTAGADYPEGHHPRGPATDAQQVHAAGALLFRILAPFWRAPQRSFVERYEGTWVPHPGVQSLRPDLDNDVARFIDACCAAAPADRPSVVELRHTLTRLAQPGDVGFSTLIEEALPVERAAELQAIDDLMLVDGARARSVPLTPMATLPQRLRDVVDVLARQIYN